MKLKNILIVVKDIEKSKQFYHDLFGLDMVLDNDGNMILTEGLVLQDKRIWEEFLEREIIAENNSCELYFEEKDIEGFVEKLEKLYPSIQYVNRFMVHSWGQKVVRFYDLDGNLIELELLCNVGAPFIFQDCHQYVIGISVSVLYRIPEHPFTPEAGLQICFFGAWIKRKYIQLQTVQVKLFKGKTAGHTDRPGADPFFTDITMEDSNTEICTLHIPVNLIDHTFTDDISVRIYDHKVISVLVVNTGQEEVYNFIMGERRFTSGKPCNLRIKRVVVLPVVILGILSFGQSEDISIFFPGYSGVICFLHF